MMRSVLVANRGEIAVRVIRTVREMGLRSIAVYSEIDRDALHVKLAHEAWNIGPAPASESYLNAARLLSIAKESQAEAIHPGYGFLAENADFAQAVTDAGIVWIGPPPEAIRIMGDKISSRRAAAAAGVPAVPGTVDPLGSAEEIEEIASEMGYPVVIKAAHGGGGKGLRVVENRDLLPDAIEGAKREADAYFGNAEVYVEKYLDRPRHIEAQVFFDGHGNGAFLGERDCSVQRRHQKLIEETPAPGVTNRQRRALGKAALAVGKACGYVNAGTVEFLLDTQGEFYFLEMNTRLQVEHTVTEMVTGLDLVREQIRVAAGESLSVKEVEPNGHAIEFRINAEDPARNFMPDPGRIVDYREPGGPGVRVDSWVGPGSIINQYYDNLIAKLVIWGRDRDEAIERSRRALAEFVTTGIATTIQAHETILWHPTFIIGAHHTRFVEDEVDLSHIENPRAGTLPEDQAVVERSLQVEVGGRRFDVKFWAQEPGPVSGPRRPPPRRMPPKLSHSAEEGDNGGVIVAPMQGTIVKVQVNAGERVDAGDPICVLEAMKMENEVRSPVAGEVIDLRIQTGDTISSGAVIAIVR